MQTPGPRGRELHVTPPAADRMVRAFARAQHGVVTTAQLATAGLGRNAIAGRVERGTLRRAHRGVYVVEDGPFTAFNAAVLATGDAAALSHRAAATVWGMLEAAPGPVDVTVTEGHRRSRPGILVHHAPADRTTRHGIPITTPQRTLQDLAAVLTPEDLERALNQAQIQRLPLPARSSSRALRAALGTDPGMTRSEAERRLLRMIREAGLPRPRTNTKVCGHEVDLHWAGHRLVVEFDSWTYHSTRAAFERDRRRDADLQLAGNRVIRVTHRQLAGDALALVARLAAALSAPGPLVN